MSESIGTAYMNVAAELDSSSLRSVEQQAASAGGTAGQGFGDMMSAKFGAGAVAIGNIIADLGMKAVSAVGDFMKDSVRTGMDFDTAMSQVAATMGTTTGEISNLRDFAKEMGASTAFSATQSAEALNYMALAGYDAETAMKMLPTVLDLAASGNMDLASASDMVTDAQSALGLSIEDTEAMVDIMAKTASTTNTSVAQLGDAFLTVGGTAKSLHGGTEELAQVLGLLADNGIKGSEGGTALRNMILSLTAPTDKAIEEMERLGIQVFDSQGEMRSMGDIMQDLSGIMGEMTTEERNASLKAIFNKVDLKSVNALLGTSAERWQEVSDKIDAAWYSTDSLDQALGDSGLSMTDMEDRLSKLGIGADVLAWALGESGGNAETFASLLHEAADSGVSMQDITDALGGDLEKLQGAFDSTAGAAKAMADTQLDNLEGDMTLLSSAMEGLQIQMYEFVEPALRGIVQLFGEMAQGATAALQGLGEAFNAFWADNIQPIIDRVAEIMAQNQIMERLQAIGEMIAGMVAGVFADLGDFLGSLLLPTIEQIAVFIAEHVIPAVVGIAETVVPVVTEIAGAVSEFAFGVLTALADVFTTLVLPAILGFAGFVVDQAVPAVTVFWEWLSVSVVPILVQFADFVRQNVVPVMSDMASFIMSTVVPALGEFFGWVADNVIPALQDLFQWVGDNVTPILSDMAAFVMDSVVPALSDIASWIGENVVPKLKDLFDWVGDNIIPIFKDLWSFIDENILPIFGDIGTALNDTVVPALKSMWEWVSDNVLPIFKDFLGVIKDVLDWLGDLASKASEAASSVINSVNQMDSYTQQQYYTPWPAYAEGGITSGPSLVGERGPEFVWPSYEPYMGKYADAIASRLSGTGGNVTITGNEFHIRSESDIDALGDALVRRWSNQQRSMSWAT